MNALNVLKCKTCGRDVKVNMRYPVKEVDCVPCLLKK